MTAHIATNYGRYGRDGYNCFAVGYPTFFAKTIKIAKAWCEEHGLEYILVR